VHRNYYNFIFHFMYIVLMCNIKSLKYVMYCIQRLISILTIIADYIAAVTNISFSKY
jgi:hypothetical protein